MINKYDKRILIYSDDVIKSLQEITPFLKNILDGYLTDIASLNPVLVTAKRAVGRSCVHPGEEYFNEWVTDQQADNQSIPSIKSAKQCLMALVTCIMMLDHDVRLEWPRDACVRAFLMATKALEDIKTAP